jgi:UDP-N-acetylmuramate--alanine ligase
LSGSIRQRGKIDPIYVEDRAELFDVLQGLLVADDILITQGAGDVGKLSKEISSHQFLTKTV